MGTLGSSGDVVVGWGVGVVGFGVGIGVVGLGVGDLVGASRDEIVFSSEHSNQKFRCQY